MKKILGVAALAVAVIVACQTEHRVGFGPGDPWSTIGGSPGGLLSNYAGPAVAPSLRSLDGGVQANTLNCANDGNSATLTFTAAGLDIGDSGIIGNACGGVINLFFDGGEIGTATALATVNLPYFYLDAGNAVFQGAGGATVICAHAINQLGLTEGPVELGTAYRCSMAAGDGGNGGMSNQFSIYGGPNPLGATGILGTITHDAGPGLVQLQYEVVGWP